MSIHGFMSVVPFHNDHKRSSRLFYQQQRDEMSRRHALLMGGRGGGILLLISSLSPTVASSLVEPSPSKKKKCTDIESCREIGEQKVEKDLIENPVTKLECGARYKILQQGTGDSTVRGNGSNVDMIYSISMLSTGYMYSKGFGNEKVLDMNGKLVPDNAGLDSYRITIGSKQIPLAIEQALVGMKRGERRRVEVPPNVGFITSNWQPEPTTSNGKAKIQSYQRLLNGTNTQPPFPAATIWDIEVLNIRN